MNKADKEMKDQQDGTLEDEAAAAATSEDADVEVRALAASLAPQMEELETLLDTPTKQWGFDSATSQHSSRKDNDDDDMDAEWSELKNSEQLLRQELEFAHDFSHIFQQQNDKEEEPSTPPQSTAVTEEGFVEIAPATPTPSSEYTLAHHARQLGFKVEPRGGWYSFPIYFDEEEVLKQQHKRECFAREYILPIPTADLKRLFVCVSSSQQQQQPAQQLQQQHPTTTVPASPPLPPSSPTPHQQQTPSLLDDASSLPSTTCSTGTAAGITVEEEVDQVLPVRTVTIRIRPDVLCGAVMDAVHHSLENLGAEVTKRQGNHLRGVVGGATRIFSPHYQVQYDDTLPSRWEEIHNQQPEQQQHGTTTTMLPPFTIDVQLVVYKGGSNDAAAAANCERMLLIRTFPIVNEQQEIVPPETTESDINVETPSLLLKESSALVQRIESEGSSSTCLIQRHHPQSSPSSSLSYLSPLKLFSSSPSQRSYSSASTTPLFPSQELIAQELIRHIRPCPSVLAGTGVTLPALSVQDWPVVQSSWRFILDCWNELETRDLAYATLAETKFGAFPALPTLDVQYCSQMRRVCREEMVVSLIKSASELEQFARESEYSCANLIQTLKTAFEYYHIQPPALPQPIPLTAYPFDYTPPQVICPPWGLKVMEAMNLVAATTSDANLSNEEIDSFAAAEKAVHLVLEAFQRQDDDEKSARLGRKNLQVMDRLAKMQAHKRASIDTIASSYGKSNVATQEADNFHTFALQAVPDNAGMEDYHEVPLFWCSILVGGTTRGTCYVTSHHLLVKTQAIPLVGGNKFTLFDLADIDFDLYRSSRLLNQIVVEGITISERGKPVFSFRPFMGAQRFKSFVEIIKEAAIENPDKLKFSDRGGLLYIYGDDANDTTAAQQSTKALLDEEVSLEEAVTTQAADSPEMHPANKETEEQAVTALPTDEEGNQIIVNQQEAALEVSNQQKGATADGAVSERGESENLEEGTISEPTSAGQSSRGADDDKDNRKQQV